MDDTQGNLKELQRQNLEREGVRRAFADLQMTHFKMGACRVFAV